MLIIKLKSFNPDNFEEDNRRNVYNRETIFYKAIYEIKTKSIIKLTENSKEDSTKLQRSMPSYMAGECIFVRLENSPWDED